MGIKFIKVSTIYFLIGITFGIYIGVADQFQFSSAHAHINLLGWVSLAIIGAIYHLFPEAGENKLAKGNFWLMMLGVPLLTFAMVLFRMGMEEFAGPMSGVGGILILIGVLVFVVNIMLNVNIKARLS